MAKHGARLITGRQLAPSARQLPRRPVDDALLARAGDGHARATPVEPPAP
jgi:hypothetical protein